MVMITPGKGKRKHCQQKFSSQVKCLLIAERTALAPRLRDTKRRVPVMHASLLQFILCAGYWGDNRGRGRG
jgi:hypothetical protein